MIQAEVGANEFQHDSGFMKARGQPLRPSSFSHRLHEWGLVDEPTIPQPIPPEDVDVIIPLSTPADRVGIQVRMPGSLPLYSPYSDVMVHFAAAMKHNMHWTLAASEVSTAFCTKWYSDEIPLASECCATVLVQTALHTLWACLTVALKLALCSKSAARR